MEERVRIVDIAEELGLSTATVSNVIHGKTKKISDETVKRVQELLEKRQYVPSMAGILLSQNNSRIVGVVVNNHEKYENKVFYVSDEQAQSQYINMFKEEGMNAVYLTHNIDNPYITHLEGKNENVKFLRIDADLADNFVGEALSEAYFFA